MIAKVGVCIAGFIIVRSVIKINDGIGHVCCMKNALLTSVRDVCGFIARVLLRLVGV